MFDISQVGEGKVRYGDGCLWHVGKQVITDSTLCTINFHFPHVVTFRLLVFKPFSSEVVLAKVKSSDEEGIRGMPFKWCFLPFKLLTY